MSSLAINESDIRGDARNPWESAESIRYHLDPSQTISAREQRMRRALRRRRLQLVKAPPRYWTRAWYGVGYEIIDPYSNTVDWGCCQRVYELTLDEVEDIVAAMRPGL